MAEPEGIAWAIDDSELAAIAGIDLAGVTADWAFGGATGRGVRVAIVDSGIEASHPDLAGCVDAGSSVSVELDDQGRPMVRPGLTEDAFGHGTACASIVHRLAPDARITSVAVLGSHLSGKAAAFHRGVAWAIDNGFDVINLSLGTNRREWALPFYELCDWAYFRNTVLVTAADNRPRATFPSLFSSVVSVAATDATDPTAFFFNPTPPTEFLAPGVGVPVAWRGGGRIQGTGNSYAAPHLTGLVALIRSKHPGLRPVHVKAVLAAIASNVAGTAAGHAATRFHSLTTAARPPHSVSDG